MVYPLIARGLFTAGKFTAKQIAKAKARRKAATEAIGKTKGGRDALKSARQGISGIKKGVDAGLGRGLGSFPQRTGTQSLGFLPRVGRGIRDVSGPLGAGGIGLGIVDQASPLVTDEDFTMQNAANLIGLGLAAHPAMKFGRYGLSRMFGRGTQKLTRLKRDKQGNIIRDKKGRAQPVKDPSGKVIRDQRQVEMSPRDARRELTLGLGAGVGIPTASAFVFGGPPEEPDYTGMEGTPNEQENIIANVTSEQRGPEETAVLKLLQKRGNIYTEQEQIDMIREAREKDGTVDEEKVVEQEAPENQIGAAPPEGESPESVKTEPEVAETEEGPVADGVDIDTNPKEALDVASSAAKEIVNTQRNPTGDDTGSLSNTAVIPQLYVDNTDIGGTLIQAEKTERDYSALRTAMGKYQDFIKDERGKVLNYEEYMKRFKDMTGDDDQAGNIALFKWAMAMMTGRTNQNGLAGFMDVAGTAGLSLGEDLMMINERNRQEIQALAGAFLQYEQDAQKYLSGLELQGLQQNIDLEAKIIEDKVVDDRDLFNKIVQLEQLRIQKADVLRKIAEAKDASLGVSKPEFALLPDDSVRYGKKPLKVGTNAEGKLVVFEITPEGEKPRLATAEELQTLDFKTPNPTQQGKIYNRLEAINTGLRYTQIVQNAELQNIASVGKVRDIYIQFTDLLDDWGSSLGVGTGGVPSNLEGDQQIRTMIQKSFMNENGEMTNLKEYNELSDMYTRDANKAADEARDIIKNGLKSKFLTGKAKDALRNKKGAELQKDIEQLAQLRLIENRMKYIVANANKGEDRLTVRDVEDAAKSTQIFGFFRTQSRKVKANYLKLNEDLNILYDQLAQAYIGYGGKEYLLKTHTYPKSYQEFYGTEKKKDLSQQSPQQLVDRLLKK